MIARNIEEQKRRQGDKKRKTGQHYGPVIGDEPDGFAPRPKKDHGEERNGNGKNVKHGLDYFMDLFTLGFLVVGFPCSVSISNTSSKKDPPV